MSTPVIELEWPGSSWCYFPAWQQRHSRTVPALSCQGGAIVALHSQPLVLEVTEGRPSYSPGTLTTCTACIRTAFNPGVQQATAQAQPGKAYWGLRCKKLMRQLPLGGRPCVSALTGART